MTASRSKTGQLAGGGSYAPISPTLESVEAALSHISPDLPHEEWAHVAMAVHDGLDGQGYELFDKWSQGGQSYKASAVRDTWKSLKPGGGVTIATLWMMALDQGWKPGSEARQEKEAERLARERRKKAREEQDAKDKIRREQEAARKANTLWRASTPLQSDHPYFFRKLPDVPPPLSLREIPADHAAEILGYAPQSGGEPLAGRLIVAPVKIDNTLSTVELIDENGWKSAIAGGPKRGGYWAAQPLPKSNGAGLTFLIGEGVATVLSAQAASGHLALAALSSNNLANLAEALRRGYPKATIVVLADLLKASGEPDAHAIKAAQAVGGLLAVPDFGDDRPAEMKDFNDLHQMRGLEAVRDALTNAKTPEVEALDQAEGLEASIPPPLEMLEFTEAEIEAANLAPRCIVKNYLFCDVAVLAAPGGAGKTTQLIHEAICIGLGRPVWGMEVKTQGWTLIVTAEDSREIFAARLREIMRHMDLTEDERHTALANVRVWDVTGEAVKLIHVRDGNLMLSPLADHIINAYRANPPVMVVFDPLISFGADESRVNDNEQALITAARRIVRGLECCVRLIHHVGKANARDKSLDQYTGRGGSALADGARMVAVLQPWDGNQKEPLPPGCTVGPDTSVTALARPKLSYAPPNQPLIFIQRKGWRFEHFAESPKQGNAERQTANAKRLETFLVSEVGRSRCHSKKTLETICGNLAMSRNEMRTALTELELGGRVQNIELPKSLQKGGKKFFICPVGFAHLADIFGEAGAHQVS
jgi:putative DNA primase/helicase